MPRPSARFPRNRSVGHAVDKHAALGRGEAASRPPNTAIVKKRNTRMGSRPANLMLTRDWRS